MRKSEQMILAAMAPANRSLFTPVQIQKLMFLIDEELAEGLGKKFFPLQAVQLRSIRWECL